MPYSSWSCVSILQRQPGEVGPSPFTRLVADPVEMGVDGSSADVQLFSDLGVRLPLCDKRKYLALPSRQRMFGMAFALSSKQISGKHGGYVGASTGH